MTDNYPEAVILAGGRGTRLRGVIDNRPKPMAIINGKPFLEWILLLLRLQGIQRVVISTGHLGEIVESYFDCGKDIGMEIAFARDPFPLGTAGAVRNALGKIKTDRILVLNGDSYLHFNLAYFLKAHLATNASASIILVPVEDTSRYGSVEVDKDGKVISFLEKSQKKQHGLINAGIYLLERNVAEEIPAGKKISLEKEIFPDLIGKNLYGVIYDELFIDIGTPESLDKAEKILKDEFEYLSQ
jgi:D-glycero-alpha-D-manno-heptose 1-phosphate guanylyltransferase